MIPTEICILGIVLVAAVGIGACRFVERPAVLQRIPVATSTLIALLTIPIALRLFTTGPCTAFGETVRVDALAMYHVLLVNVIFLIASIYATGYFAHGGTVRVAFYRRYCMLWQAFQTMLLAVLLSNNIGLMWVALEATTLVSAFLILSDSDPLSIEAMWKYLLVCSVGIVFAFIGVLLTGAAVRTSPSGSSMLLFSEITRHASSLDPKLMLLAFIFVVVGFGTKAGLAPMHTWLPDAHSQAPTPVSSVFSGVMLNCALYCIMRYMPITEAALGGDGQAHRIVLLFGVVSLVFAAAFIPVQHDMKRLLAYHSVEHMGIIAVGLGIGGLGTFAALLHTTNHSLSKVLAFFSAGHIGEAYGTRDMRRMGGAARRIPLWGMGFLVSILVLIGVAPFAVFMSEFLIVNAAFRSGRYVIVAVFLACALAVFVSALKHALDVSFGREVEPLAGAGLKPRRVDQAIVIACIVALVVLGVWIPTPFADFLKQAALTIESVR